MQNVVRKQILQAFGVSLSGFLSSHGSTQAVFLVKVKYNLITYSRVRSMITLLLFLSSVGAYHWKSFSNQSTILN
ncbi:hypothetical protein ACOSQ3_023690 [Xanthoceras sorbifolium]